MLPSRRQFRTRLTPSDNQLWAIGMVAVQWTHLELLIKMFVHGLTQNDPEARAEFDEPKSFKRRYRQLRTLVELNVIEPFRTRILTIIDQVGQMQQERDRIIHWNWMSKVPSVDPNASDTAGATNAVHFQTAEAPDSWRLDFERIKKAALKIDALNTAMVSVLIDATGGQSSFLSPDALQRISRRPSPPPAPEQD